MNIDGTDAIAAEGLVEFMPRPAIYYEKFRTHVWKASGTDRRRGRRVQRAEGFLLQIFSETVIGPIFFEFIQEKGDDGFESNEEEQVQHGMLKGIVI